MSLLATPASYAVLAQRRRVGAVLRPLRCEASHPRGWPGHRADARPVDSATSSRGASTCAAVLAVLIGTEHDALTDARLLRFSAAGELLSERPIAVDLEYYFLGSLTIDAQGRALVAGGVTWDHDGFYGVYTEDGELLSSVTMDGSFGKLDSFNGIAADPSGVALVGGVTTSDTVRDAWVVKLAP